MKIAKKNIDRYNAIAKDGRKTLPDGKYCRVAFPIMSGSGNDGEETYFVGWRVFECEIVLVTAKTVTLYALDTIQDDAPERVAGKNKIKRAKLFEGTRVLSSKHVFIVPGSPLGYDKKE